MNANVKYNPEHESALIGAHQIGVRAFGFVIWISLLSKRWI